MLNLVKQSIHTKALGTSHMVCRDGLPEDDCASLTTTDAGQSRPPFAGCQADNVGSERAVYDDLELAWAGRYYGPILGMAPAAVPQLLLRLHFMALRNQLL